MQDSNGNRITATYTSGLLTRLTASNGEYLALTYTNGLLTKVTDSTGEVSTYTYDATGQHCSATRTSSARRAYSYVTGQGARLAERPGLDHLCRQFPRLFQLRCRGPSDRRASGQQPARRDNFLRRPPAAITTTDADGNKTTVLTDDSGQVCETIDPLGNVTHYTYDVSGDLTAVGWPAGGQLCLHL